MKWHKANKELPKEFKRVLVSYWNMDCQYDEEAIMICYRCKDEWIYNGRDRYGIEATDRWAYIELPED